MRFFFFFFFGVKKEKKGEKITFVSNLSQPNDNKLSVPEKKKKKKNQSRETSKKKKKGKEKNNHLFSQRISTEKSCCYPAIVHRPSN